MATRRPWLAALCALALAAPACASSGRREAGDAESAAAVLERAVAWAGGADALGRARALAWEGDAVVHAGGRTIAIAGRWAVQPPDTAVVTTYPASQGPNAARSLVVAAPRGWVVRGGQFAPLPPGALANERDAFTLYELLRLVPLRAPGVALARLPNDSLGRRVLSVRRAARPDAELSFDADGRVARVRMSVADAETGRPVPWDVTLDGAVEADGVRWPRVIRITQNGAPYFELTARTLRTLPALRDTLLAGPR